MPEKKNGAISVELDFEKEHKHVFRYSTKAEGAAVDNVYVRKEALGGAQRPEKIKVTVSPA